MRNFKKILVYILFALVLALLAVTYIAREIITPASGEKRTVRLVIPPRGTAGDVAEMLQANGLIRHAWSFKLLVRLTKTSGKIKAGTFDLSPSQSPYEILKTLILGKGVTIRITIPEGFTLKQIAQLLGSRGIVEKEKFLQMAQNATLDLPQINERIKGLEGFLFPDTYELAPDILPEQAYLPMIERFKQLVIPTFKNSKQKTSLKEIVIMASLIERETRLAKERPLVAAVYYNRLKDGMPLQCDATIQYLLSEPTISLTSADLRIDSSYNTYLHAGLPPGPIGSPGLASIHAALYPARVPYLYYVARGDGGHTFSITYTEHLHAVRLYQKWLQEQKNQ